MKHINGKAYVADVCALCSLHNANVHVQTSCRLYRILQPHLSSTLLTLSKKGQSRRNDEKRAHLALCPITKRSKNCVSDLCLGLESLKIGSLGYKNMRLSSPFCQRADWARLPRWRDVLGESCMGASDCSTSDRLELLGSDGRIPSTTEDIITFNCYFQIIFNKHVYTRERHAHKIQATA